MNLSFKPLGGVGNGKVNVEEVDAKIRNEEFFEKTNSQKIGYKKERRKKDCGEEALHQASAPALSWWL